MFILFKAPPERTSNGMTLTWKVNSASCSGSGGWWSPRLPYRQPRARGASSRWPTPDAKVRRAIHIAIDAVSEDLQDEIQLNTAISELMKTHQCDHSVGVAELSTSVLKETLNTAPAGTLCSSSRRRLWHQLGGTSSVHRAGWPVLDPTALVQDSVDLVIQIKGKVRGTIQVPAAADKEQLEALALASEVAAKWLEGQPPRRVIVVPGKLVNLVP